MPEVFRNLEFIDCPLGKLIKCQFQNKDYNKCFDCINRFRAACDSYIGRFHFNVFVKGKEVN